MATLPFRTDSVTVSVGLSTSATDSPAMSSGVSSWAVCAPGTVLTGASFTGLTVMATVSMSCAVPSLGGDRERVGAVEVEVAGVGEAGERRVDLGGGADDRDRSGAVAAIVAPPPVVTLSVPLVTVSVVVSGAPSASATDTPAIGSVVSSLTLCAPGTVLTGASFTGLTVMAIVSMSCAVPSPVVTVSVSGPLKLRLPV